VRFAHELYAWRSRMSEASGATAFGIVCGGRCDIQLV
jgi:hypothetical protein